MTTEIVYQLETSQHFWNFSTPEKAEKTAPSLVKTGTEFHIKELTLVVENGIVLEVKERILQ